MRVYIAAPIFTPAQLVVVDKIKALLTMYDYEYFSPYDASRPIWNGRAPNDCTEEERHRVIVGNISALHWADTLIAWVGGQRHPMASTDTGVVWEMGYFNALPERPGSNLSTLAYIHPSDVKREMNLMLAETVDAIAFGQAELSQALKLLEDGSIDLCRTKFHPSKRVMHERDPIL